MYRSWENISIKSCRNRAKSLSLRHIIPSFWKPILLLIPYASPQSLFQHSLPVLSLSLTLLTFADWVFEMAGIWLDSANGRHCQENRGRERENGVLLPPSLPVIASHFQKQASPPKIFSLLGSTLSTVPLFTGSSNTVLFPYPLRSGQRNQVPVSPNLLSLGVSSSLLYPHNPELIHLLAVTSLGAGIWVLFITLSLPATIPGTSQVLRRYQC